MPNKEEIVGALDELYSDVHQVATHGATPGGAQAGLFANFNAGEFLKNLHIIVGAVGPFVPAPVGPILTAIDGVLSKINTGADTGSSTP